MAHHHFLIWVVVRKTSFFHTWQVAAIFSHTRAFAGLGRERKSKFLVKRVVVSEVQRQKEKGERQKEKGKKAK